MCFRTLIGRSILAAALLFPMMIADTVAHDETRYPNFSGQWRRAGPGAAGGLLAGGAGGLRYDESNPPSLAPNLGQKPPLTPEYQKIYDDNLDDMIQGGQGIDPTASCISPGMPRVMIGYSSFEGLTTAFAWRATIM